MKTHYLLVGEKRSAKAITMGVTWIDGRLCALTLRRALTAAGVEPTDCTFVNAYHDDGTPNTEALSVAAATSKRRGWRVVALGQKAHTSLAGYNVPHLQLIHPAARGTIRKTQRYINHVCEVLAS